MLCAGVKYNQTGPTSGPCVYPDAVVVTGLNRYVWRRMVGLDGPVSGRRRRSYFIGCNNFGVLLWTAGTCAQVLNGSTVAVDNFVCHTEGLWLRWEPV